MKKTPLKRTAGLSANVTNALRQRVYQRDGYRCALCDDPRRLQLHHVVPRNEGGPDTEMNLITLCPFCHAAAHGHDIENTRGSAAGMEAAIVEYLSDIYACEGIKPWNPWNPVEVNWKW